MQAGEAAALHTRELKSGTDTSAIGEAWQAVRNSNSSDWLLCALDPTVKDKIVVVATGTGGFSGLTAALAGRESEVIYGVCPFKLTSGQTGKKFFFLTAVGKSVSGIKRAKVSMQKQGVYNAFPGVVAEVYAASPELEELAVPAVLTKLAKDLGLGKGGEAAVELE